MGAVVSTNRVDPSTKVSKSAVHCFPDHPNSAKGVRGQFSGNRDLRSTTYPKDNTHTTTAHVHGKEKRATPALPNPKIYVEILGRKARPMPADCSSMMPTWSPMEPTANHILCLGAINRDIGVKMHSKTSVPTDIAVKRMSCLQKSVFRPGTAGPHPKSNFP